MISKNSKKKRVEKVNFLGNLYSNDFQNSFKKKTDMLLLIGYCNLHKKLVFQKDLSSRLHVSKGYVSRLLSELEKEGYLTRKPLTLTDKGKVQISKDTPVSGYNPHRIHKIGYKFGVLLNKKSKYEDGEYFTNGIRKTYDGYKLKGEYYWYELYKSKKDDSKGTIIAHINPFYANSSDDGKYKLSFFLKQIFQELEDRNFFVYYSTLYLTEIEVAVLGHKLAKALYNKYGAVGNKFLKVDASTGIPEIESIDFDTVEHVTKGYDLIEDLIKQGENKKLTKGQGGLKK